LDSIDVVFCTAKAKASGFGPGEIESGLIFLGEGSLLGTEHADDMQAIFRRDFIKIFEWIRGFRISLRIIIIGRGRVGRLKLNREEVWLVIRASVSGVLAEIDNVGMKDIIIDRVGR
jgi:hypothetical protein